MKLLMENRVLFGLQKRDEKDPASDFTLPRAGWNTICQSLVITVETQDSWITWVDMGQKDFFRKSSISEQFQGSPIPNLPTCQNPSITIKSPLNPQ